MYWVLNQRIFLSHYTSLMGQKKIVSTNDFNIGINWCEQIYKT